MMRSVRSVVNGASKEASVSAYSVNPARRMRAMSVKLSAGRFKSQSVCRQDATGTSSGPTILGYIRCRRKTSPLAAFRPG